MLRPVYHRIALLGLIAGFFVPAGPGASAKVLITIDKSTQQMTVAHNGQTLWHWPVSTGRAGRITPNGTFRAFRLEEDHYSKEWDDAPMPHSIFFTREGHAIHGSYDTKRIGTPASAGCVRLHPDNAARLFALVRDDGVLNTTVVVTGENPPTRPPAVARAPNNGGAPPLDDPVIIRPAPEPRTARQRELARRAPPPYYADDRGYYYPYYQEAPPVYRRQRPPVYRYYYGWD